MAATYEPIATTTLGSAAANVTFTSIPGTYTDLILICNAKSASTDITVEMQFNSDTATNYSWTRILGNGSTALSSRATNEVSITAGRLTSSTDSHLGIGICHIMNYSNTTTNKTTLTRSDNASSLTSAFVGLWRSTSAITSIKLFSNAGANFASGSTFTLYGIAAA